MDICKNTKNELFNYLKGVVSLKELIEKINSEYLFIVDLNTTTNKKRTILLSSYLVPEDYFAGENSYYLGGLSEFYLDYLTKFEYDYKLKESSYIINAKPSDKRHGSYLGAKEGATLLNSVTGSMESYVYITASNKYKNKFVSTTRINNVAQSLKKQLSPIISNSKIGSFEIWLAMDTITLNEVDDLGSEIRSDIIENYKRDVLDIDFSSEEDAKIICEKYTPSERKRIFEPIVGLLENEKMEITISNTKRTIRNSEKPIKVNSKFKELVLPKPSADELLTEQERKKRIYTIAVTLKEGTDISKINKKELLENLLFSDTVAETAYPIQSPIKVDNVVIELKKPLICLLKITDEGQLEISNYDFNLFAKGVDIKAVSDEIKRQFNNLIIEYKLQTSNNTFTQKTPGALADFIEVHH